MLTQAIMGAGLAYAFIRRRLVDVAFVINRGAVLGVISIIIVALVVGLDRWMDPRIETVSQSLFGKLHGSNPAVLASRFARLELCDHSDRRTLGALLRAAG